MLTSISETGRDVAAAGQVCFVGLELRTTELHAGTENLTFQENYTLAQLELLYDVFI